MKFNYPLGLLGLIAIPILILIYIILNKYTEQTVTSTYLWTLSERFLKRRNPISMIAGIISLILQILAITMISLAIAQPVIVLPNSANSYCFVLDGSGSMNMTQNGKSRFDIGRENIAGIIKNSVNGSTYTLIFAGDAPQTVYNTLTDKNRAIELMNELTCAHSSKPLSDAVDIAQRGFDVNPSTLTYVVTDKFYETSSNVEIINVYTEVENYAISNVEYKFINGILDVTGTVISYEAEKVLTVELYLEDSTKRYAYQEVTAAASEETPFRFECEVLDFRSLRLVIPEKDALDLDNEIVVYNLKYENISETLLVSDEPFFMRAALASTGNTQLTIAKTEEFEEDATYRSGYGLYIFDNYLPEVLPNDGAVWFINPKGNLAGTNFTFQGEIVARDIATYSKSTNTFVRSMLEGISKNDFELVKYDKYGLFGKYTTLISCEDSPILFTCTNTYGYREVVFGFDLHDSTGFTLHANFTTMLLHLLNYSFPNIIDETMYYSGEVMKVNVLSGCESIVIKSPNGRYSYLNTLDEAVEYELAEVGIYQITAVMKEQSDRVCYVYASVPEEERTPYSEDNYLVLLGTQRHHKIDGIYDTLLIIFIMLAVVAIADYGVYCYEQYQLR